MGQRSDFSKSCKRATEKSANATRPGGIYAANKAPVGLCLARGCHRGAPSTRDAEAFLCRKKDLNGNGDDRGMRQRCEVLAALRQRFLYPESIAKPSICCVVRHGRWTAYCIKRGRTEKIRFQDAGSARSCSRPRRHCRTASQDRWQAPRRSVPCVGTAATKGSRGC